MSHKAPGQASRIGGRLGRRAKMDDLDAIIFVCFGIYLIAIGAMLGL